MASKIVISANLSVRKQIIIKQTGIAIMKPI